MKKRKLSACIAAAVVAAAIYTGGYLAVPEDTQVAVRMNEGEVVVETKEVIKEEKPVEYKTIEKETEELKIGESEIAQEGCEGIELVTKEVTKENGEIISEEVINQEVVVESVPEITVCGTAGVAEPLDTMRETSGFGQRWGRMHEGVDLGAPEGDPIYAAREGVVTYAGECGSYGNLVKIDHGEGLETYYAHCSVIQVQEGEQVEIGQIIANVGSTGNSTGPHLHFEVREDGIAQDPELWLAESEL